MIFDVTPVSVVLMETDPDELHFEEDIEFEPPIDIYRMTGGTSLMLGSNGTGAFLSPGAMALFSMLPKEDFQKLVGEHKEFRILARSRNDSAKDLEDPITSGFSTAILSSRNRCLATEQRDFWGGIAVASHNAGEDSDGLKARRLERQIALAVARLERLSKAYTTVLSMIDLPSNNHSFKSDKYSRYLGVEYQSCLNELYGLRDAALAVAYRFSFDRTDGCNLNRLKSIVCSPQMSKTSAKLIAKSMFLPDGELLLERMSLYRSMAQHCLGTTNPIFSDIYQICTSLGPFGKVPYLVLPLYDDVKTLRDVEKGSSKGVFQKFSKAEGERFLGLLSHQDALEFCFDCLEFLLRLCEAISSETDIQPQVFTVTGKDILKAEFRKGDGTVVRLKRDASTGELVEH
jgi:hypothetical protein